MRTCIQIAILLAALYGCKKDDADPAVTNTLNPLSSSRFLATATVVEKGNFEITDHGFIVYLSTETNSQPYFQGHIVSLGSVIEHDTFCSVIDIGKIQYNYISNLKCLVRAYITNIKGTVYSDVTWKPVPLVGLSRIFPVAARTGDTIEIWGQNFETDPSLLNVTFNTVPASVISATPTSLQVIVPENIPVDSWSRYIDIAVISAGQHIQLFDIFSILPTVTGFSPSTGTWNTLITVYGSGLRYCSIMFNDQEIGHNYNSDNSVSVYVPYFVNSKRMRVSVTTGMHTVDVPGGYFIMDNMTIEPLSKTSYFPGNQIVINGTRFNPTSSYNKLIIGGHTVESNYGDMTTQNFYLPETLEPGLYVSYITNGLDTTIINQQITIVRPAITGVSPVTGYPGTQITITGTNMMMNESYPSLYLDHHHTYPTGGDNSRLYFKIPDINPGIYTLKASYGFFDVPCSQGITVLEPIVKSINPASGDNGLSVIIEGEGFGSASSISVYFGNAKAEVLSASGTRINVKVPLGLAAGLYLVQVYQNSYKLTTNVTFTVL